MKTPRSVSRPVVVAQLVERLLTAAEIGVSNFKVCNILSNKVNISLEKTKIIKKKAGIGPSKKIISAATYCTDNSECCNSEIQILNPIIPKSVKFW